MSTPKKRQRNPNPKLAAVVAATAALRGYGWRPVTPRSGLLVDGRLFRGNAFARLSISLDEALGATTRDERIDLICGKLKTAERSIRRAEERAKP